MAGPETPHQASGSGLAQEPVLQSVAEISWEVTARPEELPHGKGSPKCWRIQLVGSPEVGGYLDDLEHGWELGWAPYRPCSASHMVWGRGVGRPVEGNPAQVSPSRRPCPEVLTGPFSKSETLPPPGSYLREGCFKRSSAEQGNFSKERAHPKRGQYLLSWEFQLVSTWDLPRASFPPAALPGQGCGLGGSPPVVPLSGNEEQWLSPRVPET